MSHNENAVHSFLSQRERVSVPELQCRFSYSYKEAREAFTQLQRLHLVSKTFDGVYCAVNTKTLKPRCITTAKLQDFSGRLTAADLDYLSMLEVAAAGEDDRKLAFAIPRPTPQILFDLGLIHRFDGEVYLSVTPGTVQRIRKSVNLAPTAKVTDMISLPILHKAIKEGLRVSDILENEFLPADCRHELLRGYHHYRMGNKMPPPAPEIPDSSATTLKFEFLEAFLRRNDLETKEDYMERAKAQYEAFLKSRLTTDNLCDVLYTAVVALDEMSLAEIREIRDMLVPSLEDLDDDDLF